MSFLTRIGQLYLPASVRRKRLKQLFALTADAFGSSPPRVDGVSLDGLLERYARFTSRQAEESIRRPEAQEKVRERLYRNAFDLGCELRNRFRVRTVRDALQVARIVYGVLKIDFREDGKGDFRINRCFFSSYYRAEVCALICALDEGLMAGLTSGLKLRFTQRMTDGGDCCRAHLGMDGDGS